MARLLSPDREFWDQCGGVEVQALQLAADTLEAAFRQHGHPWHGRRDRTRASHAGLAEAAKGIFSALSEGGKVEMPLTKTFFSPCFGMLTDKFGFGWMVVVQAEP
jgi:hypothetical protein